MPPKVIQKESSKSDLSLVLHSAAWFFLLLFGYYLLRPIREQISATYGIKNLGWLFKATFVSMLIVIPTFSWLVSKVRRTRLIPIVYLFMISNLIAFSIGMRVSSEQLIYDVSVEQWVARGFYIWVSVYGLFVVSFFWSVMGDIYTTEQGKNKFGLIAAGGTVGGLIASLFIQVSIDTLGQENIILIPALLLGVAMFVYFRIEKKLEARAVHHKSIQTIQATGGNPFSGFYSIFRSKYLLMIALYGLLFSIFSTTTYFQQSEIVKNAFDYSQKLDSTETSLTTEQLQLKMQELSDKSKQGKTKFFAWINFIVQLVTFFLQTFVVGRVMSKFGLAISLSILPILYMVGIGALAIGPSTSVPILLVVGIVAVFVRSTEYAITNPSREVLFTSVEKADRYKSKSFIDTVVRRGGDVQVGTGYNYLRETVGLSMAGVSWVVIPIGALWLGIAFILGSENKKKH